MRGPATPKAVERKGVVSSYVPKGKSLTRVPSMDNKNGGGSNTRTEKTPSDKAAMSNTYPGFRGEAVDLHIKDEVRHGHLRNGGSALRGGSNRNSSHQSGNRFGK